MRLLAKLIVVTLVIAFSPQVIPGIAVSGFGAALRAAVLYGILFVLIGWLVTGIVFVFSIVPGILTLGLFFLLIPLVVNTVLLKATSGLMRSFDIRSWSAALLLSMLLAIVNYVFETSRRGG
jgi:putative membrane protein